MVTKLINIFLIAIIITSCSNNKWWGEEAPQEKFIDTTKQSSLAVTNEPSISDILEGNSALSNEAFLYLKKSINESWAKIQGKNDGRLAEDELLLLIKKRVLTFSDDVEQDVAFILSIKSLLGIKKDINKTTIDWVINWIEKNRESLRVTYQQFVNHSGELTYNNIETGIKLVASIFKRINWEKSPEQITANIENLLPSLNISTKLRIAPIAKFATEFFAFMCPTTDKSKISLNNISSCLTLFVTKFHKGEDWFNYQLNTKQNNHDPVKVLKSLDYLEIVSKEWFSQKDLGGLKTKTIISLLNAFNLPSTEDLVDSFEIVKEFEGRSTSEVFYPELILTLIDTFMKGHSDILKVMPYFQKAVKNNNCQVKNTKSWLDCSITLEKVQEITKENDSLEAFKLVQNIITPNYAKNVMPITPQEISYLLQFRSIAIQIIKTFGADKNGYLSSNNSSGNNEILELLKNYTGSIEKITNYIDRVEQSGDIEFLALTKEKKVKNESIFSDLNLTGISNLVVLIGGDILAIKDKGTRLASDKILSNLTNLFPKGSIHLNDKSITATIHLVDSFSYYRDSFISNKKLNLKVKYNPFNKMRYVEFNSFVKNIPNILKQYFPKTYKSCQDFNWDRSCQLSLEQIYTDMNTDMPGFIIESDLDVMVLIATSMEGIVNTCDFNDSGILEPSITDGADELDCTFSKISHITSRLMDSKIIDKKFNKVIKAILKVIDSNGLTRVVGKSMLSNGRLNVIGGLTHYIFEQDASIGSIYSLLGSIVAPKKSKELRRKFLRDRKQRRFQEGLDEYKAKQKRKKDKRNK